MTALPDGLEQQRGRGVALASLPLAIGAHARRSSPWLLPGVKSTSYAVNMAAQREAHRRGADDAVFVSAEGIVLEGPTSSGSRRARRCARPDSTWASGGGHARHAVGSRGG